MRSYSMRAADLPPRSEYLATLADTSYAKRAKVSVHTLGNFGAITEDPKIEVNFIHIQSLNMPQEERSQFVTNNIDSGKVYLFGRMPRIYSISGTIVDSDLDQDQGINEDDLAHKGHLAAEWDRLYEEEMRLTECLRKGQIVRIRWRLTDLFGYLMANVRAHESNMPNAFAISFTFLSLIEADYINTIPNVKINSDTIEAMLSSESVQRIWNRRPELGIAEKDERRVPRSAVGSDVKSRGKVPRA